MITNLISGIQPSGRLHIGNYLGALKNFVALQNSGEYQCYFFIADLHSITEDFNPAEKKQQILDALASFIAVGLDPKKSLLFIQSHVPAHTELAWILNTITPFGELSRMTQFKDKAGQQQNNINVGLFAYPVLQAADILLYDAHAVPIGEDQLQHLELTRTLARKFNAKFGNTFIEPQPLLTPTPRTMSFADPTKKMSKSEPSGCVFLDDEPETIEAKIMAAVTDSGSEVLFDEHAKPGIANLITIYANLAGKKIYDIEQKFRGKKYGVFKKSLAKTITTHFTAFRRKKAKLLTNPEKLIKIAFRGGKAARAITTIKIQDIRRKIGLL
jgi:tryptophanyl-tRNA synthetase